MGGADAEVDLGGGFDAVDVAAHGQAIDVGFEDVAATEACVESPGDPDVLQFADRAAGGGRDHLAKLHWDGGGSADDSFGLDSVEGCASDREEVDRATAIEPTIFGGEDGLDKVGGDAIEGDGAGLADRLVGDLAEEGAEGEVVAIAEVDRGAGLGEVGEADGGEVGEAAQGAEAD